MEPLSPAELGSLGLNLKKVEKVELLYKKGRNRLYRLVESGRSFVLKWIELPDRDVEVRGYGLLESVGVPTLPVYGRTEHAVLLEDLETSPARRLASLSDMDRPEVGAAAADWYKVLHSVSNEFLETHKGFPDFLRAGRML